MAVLALPRSASVVEGAVRMVRRAVVRLVAGVLRDVRVVQAPEERPARIAMDPLPAVEEPVMPVVASILLEVEEVRDMRAVVAADLPLLPDVVVVVEVAFGEVTKPNVSERRAPRPSDNPIHSIPRPIMVLVPPLHAPRATMVRL